MRRFMKMRGTDASYTVELQYPEHLYFQQNGHVEVNFKSKPLINNFEYFNLDISNTRISRSFYTVTSSSR